MRRTGQNKTVIPDREEDRQKERPGAPDTDKEFLRTEPLGKLLFRLALPTVVAQLINMLYNIVDRIYIGHIPDIGAAALTGVGVCMPLIMIVSAFAALVGYGGAPRASIFMGKKDKESAEKDAGKLFYTADSHFCYSDYCTSDLEPGFSSWLSGPAATPSSMGFII